MFATSVTLDVPDIAYIVGHNMPVVYGIVAIVAAAIISSAGLEIYKRRFQRKHGEKMLKRYVNLLLAALSSLFTTAAYFLVIAGDNVSLLRSIPYIGVYTGDAIGIAVMLYHLGLDKRYQWLADKLSNWGKSELPIVPVTQPTSAPVMTVTAPISNAVTSLSDRSDLLQ